MTFQEYKEQTCPINKAEKNLEAELSALFISWSVFHQIDTDGDVEINIMPVTRAEYDRMVAFMTFSSGGRLYQTKVETCTAKTINSLTEKAMEKDELAFLCPDMAEYVFQKLDKSIDITDTPS